MGLAQGSERISFWEVEMDLLRELKGLISGRIRGTSSGK